MKTKSWYGDVIKYPQLHLCILVLVASVVGLYQARAQLDTTRKEFFPLRVGNLWQYFNEDYRLYTAKIEADTIIDGQLFYVFRRIALRTSGGGITRIDSLIRVQNRRGLPTGGDSCGGSSPYELSIYRLAEPDSSVWQICENFWGLPTQNPLARFDGIFLMSVFGQVREVMRFDFGGVVQGAPYDRLFGFGAFLARGIGVLEEKYYDGAFDVLQGCVIDGVQYGNVVSVDDIPETLPSECRLAQNFPNPFNPITTIGYELPLAGLVTLKVYNILGQQTAVLVEGFLAAGKYQTTFDGKGLASGVYLYRLVAHGKVLARKMILTK